MKSKPQRSSSLRRLFKGLFSGGNPSGSDALGLYGIWPFLPGSSFDYRTEAGSLWENSIVRAAINWIATVLPEAPLGLRPEGGGWSDDFSAVNLVNFPNPFMDRHQIWGPTVFDLVVSGNAYWRKVRSGVGKPVELWPIPFYQIEPVWKSDGSEFISGYRFKQDGQNRIIPVSDVIHFRHAVSDPANPRKGLSPLTAALREICTDNEAATYTAALLRNSGVPGALISPDPAGSGNTELVFERRQREDLVALWKSKFTGDHRGEPLVVPVPMRVQPFSFDPEKMVIDRISDRAEERICALLGIPPVVLGLGTGLRNASAKASFEDSRRAAYEGCILPWQSRLAATLDRQLLPDFAESAGYTFQWNTTRVSAFQESNSELASRAIQGFQAGILTRDEARTWLNLPS